jgi:hypothetical protein
MLAVDLTSDNGKSWDPSSLHYLGPKGGTDPITNGYAAAIAVLTTVLQHLSGGKSFPLYGFGARPTPGGKSSPPALFSLARPADAKADPRVQNASEAVSAYRAAVEQVEGVRERNFAPVIDRLTAGVESLGAVTAANQHYVAAVLLTCGPMKDAEKTAEALAKATQHPCSVLIVCVSKDSAAAASTMAPVRALASGVTAFHHQEVLALRDNLSILDMAAPPGDASAAVKASTALASRALTTVCDHMVTFFQMVDIQPRAAAGDAAVSSEQMSLTVQGAGGGGKGKGK